MRLRWATRSDTGQVRPHNEDAVWPRPGSGDSDETMIVAVADGMGGHVGGEIASRTAIETATSVGGTAAIRVQAANLAVLDEAGQRPRLTGMGTTLTLAIISPEGSVEVGHVGDSRAYLLRGGDLEQITEDHSYVSEMIASGRLTPEEAEVHPYRSVVTRAIGLEPSVEVDTLDLDLEEGDRLLLCSDGLTAMLDDAAITEILDSHGDPGAAAEALVDAANQRGGDDNITVVVVDAE
ncbi:MAG TPA: Stp1/IreP family PP2C-type Ser/Thr phosphatase [Acidimicrobiia bacterium]|nr:Stp1/IreP family PP2C-type Ser/Thr phosphatase [Acidimicrobiia bacterium]